MNFFDPLTPSFWSGEGYGKLFETSKSFKSPFMRSVPWCEIKHLKVLVLLKWTFIVVQEKQKSFAKCLWLCIYENKAFEFHSITFHCLSFFSMIVGIPNNCMQAFRYTLTGGKESDLETLGQTLNFKIDIKRNLL